MRTTHQSEEWCQTCNNDILVEVTIRRTYWSQMEDEWSFTCPVCGAITEGVG